MNLRKSCRLFFRVTLSLVFAGIFYTGWLAVAIAAYKRDLDSFAVKAVLWPFAPLTTAAGFAVGTLIFDLLSRTKETKFLNTFKWSLIGCAIGAAVVCPFGPMLIVFGIFTAGTTSMVLREILRVKICPTDKPPQPPPSDQRRSKARQQ